MGKLFHSTDLVDANEDAFIPEAASDDAAVSGAVAADGSEAATSAIMRPLAEAIGPDHVRIYYANGTYAGVSCKDAERIAEIRANQGYIRFAEAIDAAIVKASAQ